jgi:methylmalonyl-CoA/ethylmalonyl-CoA epimerase
MIDSATFHHVGIAVSSIDAAASHYVEANYRATNTIFDPAQNVNIAFLERPGSPLLELVEPIDRTSPVCNILKKSGVSAYHFCFEVENLAESIRNMERKGYRVIVEPVEAIAFDNRKISFLYHVDTGLVELLEKQT